MIDCKELKDLPLLPRDEEGPVFEEPWQAQAFAVVVKLNEAGLITWKEWAQCLGGVLQEAESRGDHVVRNSPMTWSMEALRKRTRLAVKR